MNGMAAKTFSAASLALACVLMAQTAAFATSTPTPAGTIADPRVNESSSLVFSRTEPGLAYTANDQDGPVYAIQVGSGTDVDPVVGTARLVTTVQVPKLVTRWVRKVCNRRTHVCHKRYFLHQRKNTTKRRVWLPFPVVQVNTLVDPEAMAKDSAGTFWLADLGDNAFTRHGGVIYAFSEPGRGDKDVESVRYPIAYADGGSYNVETLLINPLTNAKYLVTKAANGSGLAKVMALPATLQADVPNVATEVASGLPDTIGDGAFTPDGSRVLLRDGAGGTAHVYVLEAATWQTLSTIPDSEIPPGTGPGESMAFDPANPSRYLIGFEGYNSPLYWMTLP